MHREPQPVKLYTVGPMWRYDRPQKGRYREHWQLSVEAIGSDDPAVDAEMIQLYDELLRRLGVTDYALYLNSIGDTNCRPAYLEKLEAWLDEHDAELDDEARAKRRTTPLRVFDVKSERVQALLGEAPKIGESLCDECRAHFEQVRGFLDAVGVRYELAADARPRPRLLHADDVRVQGRGDRRAGLDLRRRPLRRPDRGDRRAADARNRLRRRDRAAAALAGRARAGPRSVDVFFVADEGADRTAIAKALAELRRRGIAADMDYAGRSVKGQRTQASRLNARKVVVVEPGQTPDADAIVEELRR